MKYAWHLLRVTGQAWKVCMKKAWGLYRFLKLMRNGVVAFSYRKTNGSIRNAYGTLNFLPGTKPRARKEPSYKTITYFDVEKDQFRSFRVENFMSLF